MTLDAEARAYIRMLPSINVYKHASFPKGNVTQWFGENPALYSAHVCHTGANGKKTCLAG